MRGRLSGIDRTTALEFAAVTLIWGSTWLVIKGQLGIVPPAWSVCYRFAIASTVLTIFTVISGRWQRMTATGHGFAMLIGLAQFALNFNLVYAAEGRLTSGLVALVFALLVVPNTILSTLFLRTPLTTRFIVGTVLGLAGLILLFAQDLVAPMSRGGIATGLVFVVAAVLSASIANVMQAGRLARALPSLPTLALAMAYGTIFDAVFATITTGAPVVDPRPEYWAGLSYLAIMASVAAFSLYYHLIRRIGPGPAAYTSVIVPAVALFLSTIFEGYRLTAVSAAGAGLALIGLAVALSGRRSRPIDSRAAPPGSPETLV